MAAGGGPPSASRDRLNHGKCDDLDDKSRCSCTRQLLHSLVRVLPHSVGVLIPTERGRTPILVGSLLQLGGTLVPRTKALTHLSENLRDENSNLIFEFNL